MTSCFCNAYIHPQYDRGGEMTSCYCNAYIHPKYDRGGEMTSCFCIILPWWGDDVLFLYYITVVGR